jgi:hypothetical protein
VSHLFKPLRKHRLWDSGIEFPNQQKDPWEFRALQQADSEIFGGLDILCHVHSSSLFGEKRVSCL